VSERWPDVPEFDGTPEVDEESAENVLAGTAAEPEPDSEQDAEAEPEAEPEPVDEPESAAGPAVAAPAAEHVVGEFAVPSGYGILEGAPTGARRSVGIVVSRFNGAVTSKLLEGALAELDEAGVAREAITVMPVPGAFELPLAAMALAKTRRYACIVALGCVIRGDTPHFDFVAGEAASGLQLAALETGVPVAFGVLTLEQAGQADDRLEKGAEAVRTGLEMADVFAQLRAAAAR
jgi:6,7-dimethyl-8-ribityllumazine synthase